MAGTAPHFKLTVVGGGGKAITHGTNLVVLAQKASDLAARGYTACIKNRLGSVAELRRRDGQLTLTYVKAAQDNEHSGPAEPGWVITVRNILGLPSTEPNQEVP